MERKQLEEVTGGPVLEAVHKQLDALGYSLPGFEVRVLGRGFVLYFAEPGCEGASMIWDAETPICAFTTDNLAAMVEAGIEGMGL